MKVKGIIFDLDGVLIHTDEFHYLAWKQIADKIGVFFDRKVNDKLRGVSRMESLEIILNGAGEKFSETEKEMLAEEKNKIYRKYLSKMTERDVSSETVSVLKTLKERGFKLAVGSSSKNARYILERVGLLPCFDAVSDGNNISKSKPDPEVFLKAAEYLCLSPADCLVVEDAVAGIRAAKAGGFHSAGIGDARSAQADLCLQTLSDLLPALSD